MLKIILTAVISVTLTVVCYEFVLKNKNLIHQKEYQVPEEKQQSQTTFADQGLGMNDRVYVSKNHMKFHRMTCKEVDERTSMKKGSAIIKGFKPCPVCKP